MAQTHFHLAELWRVGYRPLYCEVGERTLVVLVTAGITSIYEKAKYLEKALGCKTLWMSRQMRGMRNVKSDGVLACCLQTLVKTLRMRERVDNVVVFMVHAAVSHTGVTKMKQLVPGIRVISYIYDFIDLFVPEEQKAIWAEYHGSPDPAKVEYAHLKDICEGKSSDGIMYKDYGPNWDHLAKANIPKLWFPQTVSKTLFQPPPDPNIPDCFCFIGTIVPKQSHSRPSGLFDDIMMEDIFRDVSDQGYRIHAYVLNPHEDVIREYQELFARDGLVKLFRGDTVDRMLKRLKGRYRWGWMLFYFPQEVVLGMVGITLPTKFFTYLALGIPPVVSEEFRAVCRLVKRYKCGVIASKEQIQNLGPLLEAQDYPKLLEGVVKARKALCLENFMPGFAKMVRRVLKRPVIEKEPWNAEESKAVQEASSAASHVRATAVDRRRTELTRRNWGRAQRRPDQPGRRGERRRKGAGG